MDSVQIDKRLGHFSINTNVGKWKPKIFSIPMGQGLSGSAAMCEPRLWNETQWIPDLAQEMQLQTQNTHTEHKHRTTKPSPGKALGEYGNAEILDTGFG